MTPKVFFTKFFFQRLKSIKTPFRGCLYGVEQHDLRIILGFTVCLPPDDDSSIFFKASRELEDITNNLPAGVEFCGYITAEEEEPDATKLLVCNDIDDSVLVTCSLNEEQKARAGKVANGKFKEIPYEILENAELLEKFYLVRIQYNSRIFLRQTPEPAWASFEEIKENLSLGKLVFLPKDSDLFLHAKIGRSKNKLDGFPSTVADIYAKITKNPEESRGKGKKEIHLEQRILNLETLINVTEDKNAHSKKSCLKIKFSSEKMLTFPLVLDGVALVPSKSTPSELYDLCVVALERNLALVVAGTQERIDREQDVLPLMPYNVKLNDFGHHFLCVWPVGVESSDSTLKDKRRVFHKTLGLPLTRPYFRRMNATPEADPNVLQNTHIGLKSSLPGGQQYLVHGTYGYYHYMQQKFDDSGWGCAYRSLQTIFSWFRHQGYTEKPIPSHYDIQEALVSVGDKNRAFLGSKQWIGSTEVSLCLEKFLNISSRIMFVQSGGDLAHKGAELAMHFESQGTPIMIGGGVLAHTIIGIDYNRISGEIKFLILDPHYTGAEDLSTIQQKGFCNWKTINFWDKKSYYNLCMPIRPIEF
ncbi:ufm1-specific protease 2 [Lutzomyia longipalpis]|uniref:ufm1-specific protease 2 n=1 Tax=Lutzomyia longipalpis TaxID=7200 RepID=UPI0024846CE8|nr:ufm1-specific protease 2 [Lutzomyia longipalpis]